MNAPMCETLIKKERKIPTVGWSIVRKIIMTWRYVERFSPGRLNYFSVDESCACTLKQSWDLNNGQTYPVSDLPGLTWRETIRK